MERNSPKDLVSFLLGFLQRKTRNWRNSPAFSVYIQQKCSNLTASNCTRVSAERAGLRAQLIYLFEPLCVWSHWHPLKKGSALFPLVSPTKGEAFIFISYPKYPKREVWGHVWTHHTCMCFGLEKDKTKRNQKEEIYVEHEGQLRRSKAESLSHFGGCCFANINAFFVCVSVYIASEVHLIVYLCFCPPTEVQCNFYELFLALKITVNQML